MHDADDETPRSPDSTPVTRRREIPLCPQCGAEVTVRKVPARGKRKASAFLGCVRYPACRGTIRLLRRKPRLREPGDDDAPELGVDDGDDAGRGRRVPMLDPDLVNDPAQDNE